MVRRATGDTVDFQAWVLLYWRVLPTTELEDRKLAASTLEGRKESSHFITESEKHRHPAHPRDLQLMAVALEQW